ncbi:hypothetical protein [Streptomyces sp. R35]|uniref:Uncharacterized protein n=1 Tax=Streptomyces sp. R35 TaxID=3238630 RepID=A0AB39SC62_9ACTN
MAEEVSEFPAAHLIEAVAIAFRSRVYAVDSLTPFFEVTLCCPALIPVNPPIGQGL